MSLNECAEINVDESVEIIDDSNELKKNKNLIVSIENSTRTRSIAREHFGMLKDSEKSIVVDRFHVYCKMCFMHPDGRKICRYKRTVSTGNLIAHLTEEHKIKSTQLSHQKVNIKRFFHSYGQSEQSSKSSKITEKKKELSDSMTIWFCRDLIPFFEAEKEGLIDFLKIHGVVQNDLDVPHPSTLSRHSLSRVYNDCVCAVKAKINEDNPSTISLTMDAWTDNYRHIPFMTFTLHWISPTETQLRSCTLQTSFLPHPHTADNIVEELKKVLREFNLNDKTITLVTDGGTNMIKAAKIMKIDRVPCIAHGLHNLVMVDTISKLPDVNSLIVKARSIVKILAFKSYDIEKAKEIIHQEDINNILDNAENLEEILEADARFDSTLFKSNDHSYTQGFPSFGTHSGLHKDVSTRWNSTLEMLSSLLKNKEAVIRCLEMNKRYDAIPADNEWKEIEGIADCLISIKTATEILSGVEYPTTNLALLFRAEVESSMYINEDDSFIIKQLKETILENINKRFPIHETHVCGALLDPTLQNVRGVAEFLTDQQQSPEEFLKYMIHKMVPLSSITEQIPNEKRDCSKSLLGIKKLRLELAAKHTNIIHHEDPILIEIKKYLHISESIEDPLQWWNKMKFSLPNLYKLVCCIYAIPITSSASERAFSSAGLLITAKRSALKPSKTNKILFIHDNFKLIKNIYLKSVKQR